MAGASAYGLGKRQMRPGASALWPGQASDAATGKRHCQQLGMRPVTLRRISQHPPVTSKLGLSSRLALPAHFHRQPGFLMCGFNCRFDHASLRILTSNLFHQGSTKKILKIRQHGFEVQLPSSRLKTFLMG